MSGTIIAIGAGIAVLGSFGAGIGIGIATGRASEAAAKEALNFELRHKKSRTAAVAARKSGRYIHKQQS